MYAVRFSSTQGILVFQVNEQAPWVVLFLFISVQFMASTTSSHCRLVPGSLLNGLLHLILPQHNPLPRPEGSLQKATLMTSEWPSPPKPSMASHCPQRSSQALKDLRITRQTSPSSLGECVFPGRSLALRAQGLWLPGYQATFRA